MHSASCRNAEIIDSIESEIVQKIGENYNGAERRISSDHDQMHIICQLTISPGKIIRNGIRDPLHFNNDLSGVRYIEKKKA